MIGMNIRGQKELGTIAKVSSILVKVLSNRDRNYEQSSSSQDLRMHLVPR